MTLRYSLVGCGKSKKDGYHPARELYDSNYFRLKRDYSERYAENYSVLSAAHGVVQPTQRLLDYDLSIHDLEDERLELYRQDVFQHLSANDWYEYDEFVVLAGSAYIEPIQDLLNELDNCHLHLDVRYPFEDTNGIGEQMAWLRQKIDDFDGEPDVPEPEDEQSPLSAFGGDSV